MMICCLSVCLSVCAGQPQGTTTQADKFSLQTVRVGTLQTECTAAEIILFFMYSLSISQYSQSESVIATNNLLQFYHHLNKRYSLSLSSSKQKTAQERAREGSQYELVLAVDISSASAPRRAPASSTATISSSSPSRVRLVPR